MSNGPGPGRSVQVELPPLVNDMGKNKIFVNPRAPIHIGNDGARATEVKLINNTGGKATLWFPSGGQIFDAATSGVDFSQLNEIPPAGLTLKVKPGPDRLPEGEYHYHVFCETINDCAQGNSEPVMDVP